MCVVAVDDQALDLMEHRRVRRVRVAAIGAAGHDRAGSAAAWPAWCGSAPGWYGCAAAAARRPARASRKKVSCICRAGCLGGKFSAVKLWKSSSMSGPSATAKPMSAKMAMISSITWLADGCAHAAARAPAASGRCARRRGARRAPRPPAPPMRSRSRLDLALQHVEGLPGLAAALGRQRRPGSSGQLGDPAFLPRAATRTASRAAGRAAAASWARISSLSVPTSASMAISSCWRAGNKKGPARPLSCHPGRRSRSAVRSNSGPRLRPGGRPRRA